VKTSRSGLRLVLAAALAAAVAFAVYLYAGPSDEGAAVPAPTPEPKVSVLVAKRDIAANTTLTAELLEVREIAPEARNARALDALEQAVGRVNTVPLSPGEQVLTTRLDREPAAGTETFAYEVPVGKRAVSIVFDEVIGSGALVQPGDFVDVIGFFEVVPYLPKTEDGSEDAPNFVVTAEQADLLVDPEEGAEVVTRVSQGDELMVLYAEGRYFRVETTDGDKGWIDAANVSPIPADLSQSTKFEKLPSSFTTTYVVQGVEVLAVAQALTPEQSGVDGEAAIPTPTPGPEATATAGGDAGKPVARPTAKSVTLAVSPEEAQRLLLAVELTDESDSELRLALRSPGDTTTVDLPPAEAGLLPVGDALGAVNRPQFPTELVITEAEFTERVLTAGTVLEFTATVKNVSERTIPAAKDAPPEFTYREGEAYDALGFFAEPGTYRIGLNFAGAFPNPFPYRWSLGRELRPGESIELVGAVRLEQTTPGTRYWLGVITEPGVVVQDGVGVAEITVNPVSAVTVEAPQAEVFREPVRGAGVVRSLERGTRLEVFESRDGWFLVRLPDGEGWIEAGAVTIAAEPTQETADPGADDLGARLNPFRRGGDR
jgi:Flp pilus assembly protein CpaB/SH3-like domain-containing protein